MFTDLWHRIEHGVQPGVDLVAGIVGATPVQISHAVQQTYHTTVENVTRLGQAVHNVGQPIATSAQNVETAINQMTTMTNNGYWLFNALGYGALAWIGWQGFGYVMPRQKRAIEAELMDTTRRIRRRL